MKQTIITIGILSISFFSGCDINKTSNNETSTHLQIETKIYPKEINPIQKNILGTWIGDCHYQENYDESYQAELIFNPNLSFSYIEKTYPTQNCIGDYYTKQNQKIGSYTLGKRTKGEDGIKAYEFETHSIVNDKMIDKYFMVRVTSSTLIFTDEKEDHSQPNGETLQTRNNYFKEVPRIIFKKQ